MKKALLGLAIASSLTTTIFTSSNIHANEWSANAAVTSSYIWRGIEQTNGKAAVSGSITYTADSGFYAGTRVSNADWAEGMTYELDLYAGFSGSISESLSYNVGFIQFAYPDETSGNADFSEVYGSLSFDALTVGVALLVDGEGGDFSDSIYANADYSFTLANEAAINLHIGSYSGDWLAQDFIDYGVSISKSGFTLGLSDTDLDNAAGDTKFYVSYSYDISL